VRLQVTSTDLAILRGVSVDQIVVPLSEVESAGGALIGCLDDDLLARRAAIGFCNVKMNKILARTNQVFGRPVGDVLDSHDVA